MAMDELQNVRGGLTRRRFLQGLAVGSASVAALAGCSPSKSEDAEEEQTEATSEEQKGESGASTAGYLYDWEQEEGEIIHGCCPKNCYDTCRICTKVVDGTAVQIRGDQDNPYTAGSPCVKGQTYLDYHYSEDRILYPMKRVGDKGPGAEFERITWDEAVEAITTRFKEIIDNEGSEAIVPYTFSGTFGLVNGCFFSGVLRFLYRMGASALMPNMCEAAGVAAIPYTFGSQQDVDPEQYGNTDLYVSWGSNISATSVHSVKFVKECVENGGKIAVINPLRIPLCQWADLWIKIRPGTDTPFALGVAKILLDEEIYDKEYVEKYCMGLDELKKVADEWPADKVAETCGCTAEELTEFAHMYAEAETAIIQIGMQVNRDSNGGSKVRAISFLPALTGNIGTSAAAGFQWLTCGYWALNFDNVCMSTKLLGAFTPGGGYVTNWDQIEAGDYKYRVINIPDYADVLNETGRYEGQPCRAVFVYNGNPLVSVPNNKRLREGLAREDVFVVVSDKWYTDTADYADYILPCTDLLETEDIHQDYHGWYLNHNTPALEPAGEAKTNIDMANTLAKAMGYDDDFFDDGIPEMAKALIEGDEGASEIYGPDMTYENLKKEHWRKLPDFVPYAKDLEEGFGTPSGKIEFYSEQLKELGYHPVVEYVPSAESKDGTPELAEKYPLNFLTVTSKDLCGSNWHNIGKIRELHGDVYCYINEADAEARGIADGDAVEVFNDRGVCDSLKAMVVGDDVIAAGTVAGLKSSWPKFMDGKNNVNVTTPGYTADFGMGTSFQANLVEVRKA